MNQDRDNTRYFQPSKQMHGNIFWHVFVTNSDTGKQGYAGCHPTEEQARQIAIEAVGIEGDFYIHRSFSRDPATAKQEYRFKNFKKTGKYWESLKPIRNTRKSQ
jgi:hypothetical protein